MIILYSILCIACLCMGFFVGYKINKPKERVVVRPKPDVKRIRENQEVDEEFKKRMEKWTRILDNINDYDGSGNNQRKVS